VIRLRPSRRDDLPFITTLERHPDNRDLIGQWTDGEHLSAIAGENGREHWIVERDGERAGYLIAYDCRPSGAGIYVKRILVGDKERGTGSAALREFLANLFARPGVAFVWLIVRNENARAQAVYRKLGFTRFDPPPADERLYEGIDDAPADRCFRMKKLV